MNAQARWDRKWRHIFAARYDTNGRRHNEAFTYAWKKMLKQDGDRPEAPGGLFRASMPLVWEYLKTGGNMNWDWTKGTWKALRGAAAAAFATVVVPALLLFAVEIGTQFDDSGELAAAGVPGWLAPMIAVLVAAGISWARNRINIKHPNNPMKKVGAQVRARLGGNSATPRK